MEYRTGEVAGAMVVEPEPRRDERGWFARLWCAEEFAAKGLIAGIAQVNTAVSPRRGTLRGMHFQLPPHDEVKVVRCFRGAVFDVVVDLRRDSPTWKRWMGVELTAVNARMLYVPQGCAHGYLTLEDDAELMYLTSRPYAPEAARGVRYDDPAFGIRWPAPVTLVSAADAGWPLYAG